MFRDFSFIFGRRRQAILVGDGGGPREIDGRWRCTRARRAGVACSIFAMQTASDYLHRLARAARRVQGPRSGRFGRLDTGTCASGSAVGRWCVVVLRDVRLL